MESKVKEIGSSHLHIHSIHLYKLISSLPENANVLEIGVGGGRSTRIILLTLNGTLYSIDRKNKRKIAREYNNWKFIEGYDLDILRTWSIPLDLVFIDIDRDSDSKHYTELLNLLVKHLRDKNSMICIYNTIVFRNNIIPSIENFIKEFPEYKFYNISSKHGMGIISKNIELVKKVLE